MSNLSSFLLTAAATNALPPTSGLPQQAVSPVTAGLHRKDDRPHHSSPGSPVVFSQQPSLNEHTPHHSSQPAPPLSAAPSNLVSSSPLSHSSNASSPVPVAQPSVPTVNLQAIAKYVDKNLASHLSSWPTETVDRQVRTEVCLRLHPCYAEGIFKWCFHSENASEVFIHTTPEEFKNTIITGHFGFVFEEHSVREIT